MKGQGRFRQQEIKDSDFLEEIRAEVEKDWLYWRPIAYGLVKIDKKDYDMEGPRFLFKLNAAMDYMAGLESGPLQGDFETDYDDDF